MAFFFDRASHTNFSPSLSTSSDVALVNTTGLPDEAPTQLMVVSVFDSTMSCLSRNSESTISSLSIVGPSNLIITPPSLSAETLKSARFFSVSETGESVATELSDRKLNRIV